MITKITHAPFASHFADSSAARLPAVVPTRETFHSPIVTIAPEGMSLPAHFTTSPAALRMQLGLSPEPAPIAPPFLEEAALRSDAELVAQWQAQARGQLKLPDTDDAQALGRFIADDNNFRLGDYYLRGKEKNVEVRDFDARGFLAFHEKHGGLLDPELLALIREDRSDSRYHVVSGPKYWSEVFDEIAPPHQGLLWSAKKNRIKDSPRSQRRPYKEIFHQAFLPCRIHEQNLLRLGLRLKYLPDEPDFKELTAWLRRGFRVVSVRAGNPWIELGDLDAEVTYNLYTLHDLQHAYYIAASMPNQRFSLAFLDLLEKILAEKKLSPKIRRQVRQGCELLVDTGHVGEGMSWIQRGIEDVLKNIKLQRPIQETDFTVARQLLSITEALRRFGDAILAAGFQDQLHFQRDDDGNVIQGEVARNVEILKAPIAELKPMLSRRKK